MASARCFPASLCCLVLLALTQGLVDAQLNVGAFNIQVFGQAKMGKPDVVEVLKKILIRYDIVLIQEIRDASNTAIHELLRQVNSMGAGTWQMMLSERLGRTTSKEQYAFFYKQSTVSVVNVHQWPDVGDVFEREPYIVRFRPLGNYAVGDFAFLGIHVKPDDAVAEIDKLYDVYQSVSAMWNLPEMILGGDFNAGCTYVRAADWPKIRLRTDSSFLWTIGDDANTTVNQNTQCPYDRMVLAGARLRNNYVAGSAVVHRFDTIQNIPHALALEVSDHYPVEVRLR
jgi:endonuclease/exonuclease/phosphatase family metal-dependent hydrolase